MKRLPTVLLLVVAVSLLTTSAFAQDSSEGHVRRVAVTFMPAAIPAADASPRPRLRFSDAVAAALPSVAAVAAQAPPVAFEYSDAYNLRARIHRVASFATLPLFAAEGLIGESLYNSSTPGKKTAHLAIGGAIAGLFAVNSVTGVWNLVEARKDPTGRKRRLIHGILMLAADAGFLATAMSGPGGDHRRLGQTTEVEGSKSTHRAIAFTSIGLATAGYFTMIIGGH